MHDFSEVQYQVQLQVLSGTLPAIIRHLPYPVPLGVISVSTIFPNTGPPSLWPGRCLRRSQVEIDRMAQPLSLTCGYLTCNCKGVPDE